MKKTAYIAPTIKMTEITMRQQLMAGSVTSVGGDTDITMGEGDAPTSADSRRSFWDDED